MVLTGYPVEDLALRPSFVDAVPATARPAGRRSSPTTGSATSPSSSATRPRAGTDDAAPGVGRPEGRAAERRRRAARRPGRRPLRQAPPAQLRRLRRVPLLRPRRTILPVVRVHGVDVALAICEDLWQDGGPVARGRASAGAGLLLVHQRLAVRAQQGRRPAASSCAPAGRARPAARSPTSTWSAGRTSWSSTATRSSSTPTATVLARAPQFDEEPARRRPRPARGDAATTDRRRATCTTMHVDRAILADEPVPPYEPTRRPASPAARRRGRGLRARWSLGAARLRAQERLPVGRARACPAASTRRWSRRSPCDALGAENVVRGLHARATGPREHSEDDAAELAARTGLHYRTVPIAPMVDAFRGRRCQLDGLAEENLQARVRGVILMALSNQHGHLVLATGNKSELAVGYSTIYGDAVGGFAPIKDVPKTLVWELARWRNAEATRRGEPPPIPEDVDHQAAVRRAAARAARHATRCPPYDAARRRARRLRRAATAGRAELVATGFDRRLVDRVIAAGRPRRVQAAAVPARPEDLARAPSAATAGCRSPTAGARACPAARRRRTQAGRQTRRGPSRQPTE